LSKFYSVFFFGQPSRGVLLRQLFQSKALGCRKLFAKLSCPNQLFQSKIDTSGTTEKWMYVFILCVTEEPNAPPTTQLHPPDPTVLPPNPLPAPPIDSLPPFAPSPLAAPSHSFSHSVRIRSAIVWYTFPWLTGAWNALIATEIIDWRISSVMSVEKMLTLLFKLGVALALPSLSLFASLVDIAVGV